MTWCQCCLWVLPVCPDVCLEKCDLQALALLWRGDEMEIVLSQWEMLWMEQEVPLLENRARGKHFWLILTQPRSASQCFFFADHDVVACAAQVTD